MCLCESPLSNSTRVLPSSMCSVTVPSPRMACRTRLPTDGVIGTDAQIRPKCENLDETSAIFFSRAIPEVFFFRARFQRFLCSFLTSST